MTRNVVLIDLDDTLADARWRASLIDVSGWDAYHAACIADQPAQDVADIIAALHKAGYYILAITGRNEKWRQLTNEWLLKHAILVDELLMRGDSDFRKAPILKREMLEGRYGQGWPRHLLCAFEDNEDVGNALIEADVTLFKVFNRRYDAETKKA